MKGDKKESSVKPLKGGNNVLYLFPEASREGWPEQAQGEIEMDLDALIDGLSEELQAAIRAMAKAETLEEKKTYSEIVKNLSESLASFLNIISDMVLDYDMDEFEE